MSTTTQILFNSPALHSLKREQLVKLCKIHSLKANGKNVDIIQRLRQHAQALPKESPLSVAARSECDGPIPCEPMETDEDQHMMQEDEVRPTMCMPRPSEQWEMVMDRIEEVEENSSQGTFSSQRTVNHTGSEFGTGGSGASTVSSSIRALATSLGLRRNMTKLPYDTNSSKTTTDSHVPDNDDLAKNSKPYSTLPVPMALPQTDHFTLDTGRPSLGGTEEPLPLPGHASRPGIPAPLNARLSLGLGIGVPVTPTRKAQPTTTIRLVSNPLSQQDCPNISSYDDRESRTPQLKPFQTTFDITFGSPVPANPFNSGFSALTSWPRERTDDTEMTTLTSDVIAPSISSPQVSPSMSKPKLGSHVGISPQLKVLTSAPPFIFGSPHHRVSNNQFREAATSVLEEMNARLRADGVDEIGVDIINKLHPTREYSSAAQRDIKPIPTSKRGEITSKFNEVHQQEFSKMEGIDDTFRKRRTQPKDVQPETKEQGTEIGNMVGGRKRKSNVLEPQRPSVLANKARLSTTRVISNGRRSKVVPGGFGLDDEDEEDPDDSRAGKRVRTDSDSLTRTEESKRKEDERELQLEKEKEAIRKRLEVNRARRRSSAAARKSLGRNGPRPSVLIKPRPKPSRFGFLASAKSLVQSVWNRSKPSASAPPSSIPKLAAAAPAQAELVHGQVPLLKEEKGKTKMPPPSFVPNRKAALAPAKPTTFIASGSKATKNLASECPPATQTQGSLLSTRSPRSRSPLPDASTFSSNSSSGTASGRGSRSTRAGSFLGTARSRTSAGISSVGRFSGLRNVNSGSSDIGSMGTKMTIGGGPSNSSVGTAVSSSSSSTTRTMNRTSSRLLAPTASSLAKTVHPSSNSAIAGTPSATAGDAGRAKNSEKRNEKTALGSITNSPATNQAGYSSSPHGKGRIFTKSLLLPQSDSGDVGEDLSSNVALPQKSPPLKRTFSSRKPRISRSKVIAKLASQRAASGSSISSSRSSGSGTSILKPRIADSSGRTRSSLGLKVTRASYGSGGGLKSRTSGGNGALLLNAKRSARQSEYSRRRSSRVARAEGQSERCGLMELDSMATGSDD